MSSRIRFIDRDRGKPVAVTDQFELERFVSAQDRGGTYAAAVSELRAGRKTSHWMWFVFPQIDGLGRSPTARMYAISSPAEARAYLDHPVLGPRLRESTQILMDLDAMSAEDIFGPVDAMKLRSSMTLFSRAAPDDPIFGEMLAKYFEGVGDDATEARL